MRTLLSGIAAVTMLTGCATTPVGVWVSDGRGGFCYQQSETCSYTGAEPVANTSAKWWQFTADMLGAANQGMNAAGRGVYPDKHPAFR